jgi:hypothetical protein
VIPDDYARAQSEQVTTPARVTTPVLDAPRESGGELFKPKLPFSSDEAASELAKPQFFERLINNLRCAKV